MKLNFKSVLTTSLILLVLLGAMAVGVYGQDEKVTNIKFWHAMGGTRVDFIKRMVEDFNLFHPNIEVSVSYKGSYRETLTAAQAAAKTGNAPHVVQSFDIGTRENIDSGLFVPAGNLIDRFGIEVEWDDYIDSALNYYRVGGKLWGFPWNSSNAILYYNKDKFEEAGVTIPEKPTFEDIVEISQELVDSGVVEGGITWPLHTWFFEQWMAEQGQVLVNNGNGRQDRPTEIFLESDEAKRIFTWWKELYDKGLWKNPGVEAWAQANSLFLGETVAMEITSTSDVTGMEKNAAENGFELGTTYLPIPEGTERNGEVIGGGNLWITEGHSEAKLEAAVTFALWMSNIENSIRWHKGTGYFPIRKSSVDILEREGWFERSPNSRTAFDQLLDTKSNAATAGALIGPFRQIRTIVEEAFQKVMGGTSVDKALAQADKEAENAMEEYQEIVSS
ncbi:ABC transporter substrate-binding protein [Candidatus Bipolaricaulota bacterium]|nr:ABC transporter substrate-binding protein [Candidatus Bipolaricaulota bacterium]